VSRFLFLVSLEVNIAAVAFGPHGEVHPDGRAALLEDEFIEVQLLPIRDVQQD
jgi:hypothetical protein